MSSACTYSGRCTFETIPTLVGRSLCSGLHCCHRKVGQATTIVVTKEPKTRSLYATTEGGQGRDLEGSAQHSPVCVAGGRWARPGRLFVCGIKGKHREGGKNENSHTDEVNHRHRHLFCHISPLFYQSSVTVSFLL